jgi:hypothetical protein
MHVDVFTLFPGIFDGPLDESILKRAQEMGRLSVALHNVRDYTTDKHHITDDYPYGGGGGMVMKPEPIFAAVEDVLGAALPHVPIILPSPQGRLFNQALARELAAHERLALICGRYEGVDERVRQFLVTDEISIGDYVLTGGELPALVLIDGCAGERGRHARRFPRQRSTGIPALYPSGRVSWSRCARGVVVWTSRPGGPLAPAASGASHLGTPSRAVGAGRPDPRGSGLLGDVDATVGREKGEIGLTFEPLS